VRSRNFRRRVGNRGIEFELEAGGRIGTVERGFARKHCVFLSFFLEAAARFPPID